MKSLVTSEQLQSHMMSLKNTMTNEFKLLLEKQ